MPRCDNGTRAVSKTAFLRDFQVRFLVWAFDKMEENNIERCKTCNSIICEITLFNGETKHFCSVDCINTLELIESFRDYIQKFIDKYQYIDKKSLIDFLQPEVNKKKVKELISEVVRRGYFVINKSFICPKNKIIKIPRTN